MAWPRDTQADLIAFYGDPARDAVAPQLVKVMPPFRMTYDGKALSHLMFHRLAAPALERALQRVWDYYGRDQAKVDALGISKTAGTYNKRFISGTTRWSNHAFGAAIDINAAENGFNMVGNIPIPMVAAFKAEGARWGGDYKGRTDPMHFEFCASGEPARTFEQWLAFYGAPTGAVLETEQPMRFTDITATVFGGPDDEMSGNETAYSDVKGAWWDRPGVALPYRFEGKRPRVRVRYQGRTVDCDIIDQGPWNYTSAAKGYPGDPYWKTGTRPAAESGRARDGRTTNKAGIDLTPAAANAIGLPGKGLVDWDFVDHLEAANGDVLDPLPQQPPPVDTATNILPVLLLLLLTKENSMPNETAPAQGQDLLKLLLPLILNSAISGKPIDQNDLLRILLAGILGVPALAAPSSPTADPAPSAPAPAPTQNDLLMELLKQLAAGKMAPQKPAEPAPVPAAPKPAPAPAAPAATGGPDLWAKVLGFLGAGSAAVAGATGVVEPSTAMTFGISSLVPLVGGIIGIFNPTLGGAISSIGSLLHRATAPK